LGESLYKQFQEFDMLKYKTFKEEICLLRWKRKKKKKKKKKKKR